MPKKENANCKTGNCKTLDCKTQEKLLIETVIRVNDISIVLTALIQTMIDDGTLIEDKLNAFIKELQDQNKSR